MAIVFGSCGDPDCPICGDASQGNDVEDDLIRFWRVEGVTYPEPGRFGSAFCHVTLARDAEEAQQKVASKIPPFSNITATYAVN